MTEKSARKYISALALALDLKALAPSTTETGCRTRGSEEQSVEAWLHHGQKARVIDTPLQMLISMVMYPCFSPTMNFFIEQKKLNVF